MTFTSPGPIIFNLGPITLRWYGLLIAIGFYIALNYASSIIQKRSIHKNIEEYQNFAFALLLGGIVGARLWYVILDWQYFQNHLLQAPQIWLGGISIQGGLLGAIITALIFYSKDLNKMLHYLSASACALPLAQAIGRWGNFFNEEAFGRVTDLPWKLYISHTQEYHHPTFLYESLTNLVIFLLLFLYNKCIYQSSKKHDLRIIALYLFFYSLFRFFIEAIRIDSLNIGTFAAAQVLSLLAIVIALVLWIISSVISTKP